MSGGNPPADLAEFVQWSSVKCWTQSGRCRSILNALEPGSREDEHLYLESDVNQKLLIHIPLKKAVRLHSISIKGPEQEGPKTVHLFANREHIRFRNVDKFVPFETITCFKETQWNADVLFVRRLILFIDTNHGSEITKVQKIALYGNTMDGNDSRYSFKEIGADPDIPLDIRLIVEERYRQLQKKALKIHPPAQRVFESFNRLIGALSREEEATTVSQLRYKIICDFEVAIYNSTGYKQPRYAFLKDVRRIQEVCTFESISDCCRLDLEHRLDLYVVHWVAYHGSQLFDRTEMFPGRPIGNGGMCRCWN